MIDELNKINIDYFGGKMNKRLKLILAFFSIFSIVLLHAEHIDNNAEYGFQSLKINLSPALSAQAGTGAFYSTSAANIFNDPVSALNNKSKSIHLSQIQNSLFDVTHYSLAWRNSGLNSSIGVGFSSLDYGTQIERLENGIAIGEFHPLDINLAVNYAYRVSSNHLAGITVHGLYSKVYTASTIGTAFDLGYAYLSPIKNLNFTLNAKNMGFTDKMKDEKINIPYTLDAGTNYLHEFSDFVKVNGEVKLIKNEDDDNLKMAFGAQTTLYNILSLRAGYKTNHDTEDFTTGLGLKWNHYEIDYSYIPVKISSFGDIHYIGFSWYY